MASSFTAPKNLPELVRSAFVRARTTGDLIFFPTQVALLRINGIPFQLRFAPSLGKKPKGPKQEAKEKGGQDKKTFNPFEDPVPGLLVVPQLGPSHRLVLNKFAISKDHAILATTVFRPQHHLLDPADLAAAYACIEAYQSSDEELYVFFNSGGNSGASQPHRHLQLLPVAQMREGLEGGDAPEWGILVDKAAGDGKTQQLPFYVATARLTGPQSAEQLHTTYLGLYRKACAAAKSTSAYVADGEVSQADEEGGRVPARISYNLALTKTTMAILPRTSEGSIVSTGGGTPDGFVSLNGTVLAGTALVKNEAEWDALRHDSAHLLRVLEKIGVSTRGSPPASL
ncbi:ap4a phosphorylase ii [Ophiostoma piceae UAMH 11346]|uniref:Ap4a phosphorylase ii n=1 Tax=Ophiostoma piceae (strain UAMH 11346) TaxID=1262450 RepID=S3CBC3_OPHP1|nr:ap4a phosphorylase ii [Ophiostoma piceae UAMH 11346]